MNNDAPTLVGTHFAIYAPQSLNDFSQKLMEYMQKKAENILGVFGTQKFELVDIFLFDNRDDFIANEIKRGLTPRAYSEGAFGNGAIYYLINTQRLGEPFFENNKIRNISHEFVHLVFKKHTKESIKKRIVWLDEGCAQCFSGEKWKLDTDEGAFKQFFENDIVASNLIIPPLDFLCKHGSRYGEFVDMETNKYSGYKLSYLMVRYLIETCGVEEFIRILKIEKDIAEISVDILNKAVDFYKNKFEISSDD